MGAAACSDPIKTDAVATYSQIVEGAMRIRFRPHKSWLLRWTTWLLPSAAALTDAQTAWLDSREPYLQTEVSLRWAH